MVTVKSLPRVTEPPTLPGFLSQVFYWTMPFSPPKRSLSGVAKVDSGLRATGSPWLGTCPLFLVTAACVPPGLRQKWLLEVSLVGLLLHGPS